MIPRNWKVFASLAALAFAWFTFPFSTEIAHSSTPGSISFEGLLRTYSVYVPQNVAGNPSVVLVFHGNGATSADAEAQSQMDAVADANGFIVVYPDGVSNLSAYGDTLQHWNDGRISGISFNDVGFVSALIAKLSDDYNINRRKVYAIGISNGGSFVERLGMQLSNKIAAIAPINGPIPTNLLSSASAKPIPIVAFFGTDDSKIPYVGGTTKFLKSGTVLSVPDSMQKWSEANQCLSPSAATTLPHTGSNSTFVDKVTYPNCQSGKEVILYRVNRGGHNWPGGNLGSEDSGTITGDISASQIAWSFFQNYSIGAPSVTLTANPTTILQGQSSTLTASTSNSTSCSLNQNIGNIAINGFQPVSPITTTTYTITCANDVGSATSQATVTVTSPTASDIIGQKLTGWTWSENMGWIHFGSSIGAPYNATILPDGTLYGYAWSEYIGWMSFTPQGPYPTTPSYPAKVDVNGNFSGWFRALVGVDSGGWDGWMKFDQGGNYGTGVTLDSACKLQGWAWGGDNIGWVHMTNSPGSPAYSISIACGTVSNLAANVSGETVVCASSPQAVISWSYSNSNGESQSAYQVQVSTVSDFSSIIVDSGKVVSNSSSYIISSGSLSFNTQYYYRVRGWSGDDFIPSPYVNSSFTTAAHQGPTPGFSWISTKPQKGITATITDTSTTSGGSTIISRTWTYPDTATTTSPAGDAIQIVRFDDLSNNVTLSITDSNGLTCSVSQQITGRPSVPDFKEIKPQ